MNSLKLELSVSPVTTILDEITLFEPINIDIVYQLYNSNYTTDQDKLSLKKYIQKYDEDTKQVSVEYSRSKCRFGRSRIKTGFVGLTSIRRAVRNTILNDEWIDLDIVKCHPSIIVSLCKDNVDINSINDYVNNPEIYVKQIKDTYSCDDLTAKQALNIICFGGSFDTWKTEYNVQGNVLPFFVSFKNDIDKVCNYLRKHNTVLYEFAKKQKEAKDSKNYNGSFLSYYLQEQELRIIEFAIKFFIDKKILKEPYCFTYEYDGIKIPKSYFQDNLDSLLKELNGLIPVVFISKNTNEKYDVSNIKPTPIKQPTKKEIKEQQQKEIFNKLSSEPGFKTIEQNDDDKASLYMYQQFKDRIVYSNKQFYLSTEPNIWVVSNEKELTSFMSTHNELKIYIKQDDKLILYSTSVKHQTNMFKNTLAYFQKFKDDKFQNKLWKSNIDYLFFKDLIYCFKDKEFYTYEDLPDVLSPFKLSYNAPVCIDVKNEKIIYEKILKPLFKNKESIDYFLYTIQCCLTGNSYYKFMNLFIGVRDCGKSALAFLFQELLEKYCSTTNSSNLYSKNENSDSARQYQWASVLEFSRMCFMSEIKQGKKLDGQMIKTIVSGTDVITVRNIWESERKMFPQAKMFLLSNDFPDVDMPDAFNNLNKFQFSNKFVSEITEQHEKINKIGVFRFETKDSSVLSLLDNDDMKQAFLSIILNAEKVVKPIEIQQIEDLDDVSEKKLFDKFFTITYNSSNMVEAKEISTKLNIKGSKLKGLLEEWGCVYKRTNSSIQYLNLIKKVDDSNDDFIIDDDSKKCKV